MKVLKQGTKPVWVGTTVTCPNCGRSVLLEEGDLRHPCVVPSASGITVYCERCGTYNAVITKGGN